MPEEMKEVAMTYLDGRLKKYTKILKACIINNFKSGTKTFPLFALDIKSIREKMIPNTEVFLRV